MAATIVAKRGATGAPENRSRIILIFAPKGGQGKTTISANLAVGAAKAGQSVVGLDFDTQRHFTTWAMERGERDEAETLARVQVYAAHLKDWREEVRLVRRHDVVIIDTPPRADDEDVVTYLQEIGTAADMILMPVEMYGASIRYVIQFMSWWSKKDDRAMFVLNKTIAGRTMLRDARESLQQAGQVWDINIPLWDDIARQLDLGLAAMDDKDFQGADIFAALWKTCSVRMGIAA
jgi:chromosome partitioning protein